MFEFSICVVMLSVRVSLRVNKSCQLVCFQFGHLSLCVKVMNYLIPIIIKVLFCSYVCMLFLYCLFIPPFLFILFRSNTNDENHEYLAPVIDENTNIACGPTGLVVRGDVENPKEI